MTIHEAKANIGNQFKWAWSAHWDIIKEVTEDGMIIGDMIEAPVEDCRLKQEQPPQLVKKKGCNHVVITNTGSEPSRCIKCGETFGTNTSTPLP